MVVAIPTPLSDTAFVRSMLPQWSICRRGFTAYRLVERDEACPSSSCRKDPPGSTPNANPGRENAGGFVRVGQNANPASLAPYRIFLGTAQVPGASPKCCRMASIVHTTLLGRAKFKGSIARKAIARSRFSRSRAHAWLQNNCPARSSGMCSCDNGRLGTGRYKSRPRYQAILLALHFSTVKGVCALNAA